MCWAKTSQPEMVLGEIRSAGEVPSQSPGRKAHFRDTLRLKRQNVLGTVEGARFQLRMRDQGESTIALGHRKTEHLVRCNTFACLQTTSPGSTDCRRRPTRRGTRARRGSASIRTPRVLMHGKRQESARSALVMSVDVCVCVRTVMCRSSLW